MKTALYDEQIKKMGKSLIPQMAALLKPAAYFLLGTVLAQFDIAEDLSPFSYAAVSACPEDMLFSCFFGCCAGYLLRGSFLKTVYRYITLCAVLFLRVLADRKTVMRRRSRASRLRFLCLSASVIPAACSAVRIAINGFSVYTVLCSGCEAALAAVCFLFFERFFTVPFLHIGIQRLSHRDRIYVYSSLFILVLCASGIKVSIIRPAHIGMMLFVLLISHYKGLTGGSLCSVAVGAALCFQPECRHLLPFFALGGFASGLFSTLGQAGCAVAFCFAAVACALFRGCTAESLITVFEAAGAGISFALAPHDLIIKIENYLDEFGYIGTQDETKGDAAQLIKASRSIDEAAQMVQKVFSDAKENAKTPLLHLYTDLQQTVCRECEQKTMCWSEGFESTSRSVRRIVQGKRADESRCLHNEELCGAIKNLTAKYNDALSTETESDEMRLIAFDSLRLSAKLLEDAAHRLSSSRIYDFTKSEMLTRQLTEQEFPVKRTVYCSDLDGRAYVSVLLHSESVLPDARQIKDIVSAATLKSFEEPKMSIADSYIRLDYTQSPYYDIRCGYISLSASEGCECGDSAAFFTDADGDTVCVISDGMGTGYAAAVDGTLTSTMVKKLIQAGFSFESTLEFVNAALMVKSPDESLATVDLLRINVRTGAALFCKAGAAESLIRSGEKITVVGKPSLPPGILRGIGFTSEELRLENGNIILMLSDGAMPGEDEWIKAELLAWNGTDMNELARHIASMAKNRTDKAHRDDITVAALYIHH